MAVPNFAVLDYVVLMGFLSLSAGIGIFVAWQDRRKKSSKHFMTGNRQLSWLPVSLSMMASYLSSIGILGQPSEVFLRGSTLWISAISSTVSIVVAAFVFLPMYYKMDITSINEGGIKAVIWTDVVQMVLMFAGYIMVIVSGLQHLGGFENMWRIASDGGRVIYANFSTSVYDTYTSWNVLLGYTVIWMVTYCSSQTQVQRYSSMKSLESARRALLLNIPGVAGNLLLSVLSGMTLYAVYGDCDPRLTGDIDKADQLMPYAVQDLLRDYPGLSGLLVAAVLSGSLSTLSSGYNALAAVTWDDFVRPRVNISEGATLRLTKAMAAAYGLLSISIAFLAGTMESIMQAASSLVGALSGPLLAMFVLGIFFPCCKKKVRVEVRGIRSPIIVVPSFRS
ncbi:hypothetical protein HPB49_025575 [Dermacentor silvarum]|uniref:Uncharacterized protein n=1 Tax=Dermacentor silvarum TaxID=543639 RepID=A0ACB8CCB7_DERSI|nr:hypothetical protein HPB49_025575 [Dermacentor silvarum]